MTATRRVLVSGAPFIHGARTTARDAWFVSALLVLVLGWESLLSGWGLPLSAAASVAAALLAEVLQSGLRRRFELDDGTAFLTGILIALVLPQGLPLYIPIVASAFAILVVKGAFGGLGNNWMNPALGGLAFAWLDWPSQFSAALHATSSLSPILPSLPGLIVGFDEWVSASLNSFLFQPLGATMPSGYFATLLGLGSGGLPGLPMGLVLVLSTVLIGKRIIHWQIPASMFLFFALPIWVFGDVGSADFFSGDALGHSLAGSFLLVAFFMATDPVTSPSKQARMIIFGGASGLIAFLFVYFGAPALAPILAVLFMNSLMPFIDESVGRLSRGRRG